MAELLWKECADWLVRCGVLPVDHRVKWRDSQLIDLANTLRDGVLICHLLNNLDPGCLDLKEINLRPQMSQFLCLKNIRFFIVTCQKVFDLDSSDLFEPAMLFDYTDFGQVLRTLSKLSNCPKAQSSGIRGFPSYSRAPSHDYCNDDIYKNLQDLENHNPCSPLVEESHYDRLLLQPRLQEWNREEDVYEDLCYVTFKVGLNKLCPGKCPDSSSNDRSESEHENIYNYGDFGTRVSNDEEGIYEDLCCFQKEVTVVPQAPKEKRDHCIGELVETEKNYVEVLNALILTFMRPLKNVVKAEDLKVIFLNVKELYDVHIGFNAELMKTCSGSGAAGTPKLSDCFIQYKIQFVLYGEFCNNLPTAQSLIDELCTKNETINQAVARCQSEFKEGKFKLRDLLSVPMQRVLKYHLFLQRLVECTSSSHDDYHGLKNAYEAMKDVNEYINEVKRDHETLQIIYDIQNHITDLSMPTDMSLKDYGRLLRDGELKLRSHKHGNKLKNRYIFIFDRIMLICKTTRMMDKLMSPRGDLYSFKEALILHDYRVDVPPKTPGKDKWSHSWFLVHSTNALAITMLAKTEESKNKWVESFKAAINNTRLNELPATDHCFSMKTFEKPTICDHCQKLLCGIFYQGYKCQSCGMSVHKACIESVRSCGAPSLPPRPYHSSSESSLDTTSTLPCTLVAIKPYRSSLQGYLSFEANDVIVELEKISAQVSVGMVQRTRQEGRFLRAYAEEKDAKDAIVYAGLQQSSLRSPSVHSPPNLPSPSSLPPRISNYAYVNLKLEEYNWFAGKMDHETATNTIDKLPNGAFLVRISERQNGKFAISLKHENKVKHMRVCTSEDGELFYLSETKYFKTIVELVRWYEENSLAESFNGLDTTLARPFQLLLNGPDPISYAVADYDFCATSSNMLSLRKGDRIAILSKKGGDKGWWKGRIEARIGYFPLAYVTEEIPAENNNDVQLLPNL